MLDKFFRFIYVWTHLPLIRFGWWKYRREQKHPISLYRAFFRPFPRFSAYERDEVGCPDWALRDYKIVEDLDAVSITEGST